MTAPLTYAAALANLEAHARHVLPPDPPVLVKVGTFPPFAIGGKGVIRSPSAPLPETTVVIADEATLTELRDRPGTILTLILRGKVKVTGSRGAAGGLALYIGAALKAAP